MKRFNLRHEILLQLVESAQDGIVVAEKEGDDTILVYVNPAFERLTGYSADEILSQDCRFLQSLRYYSSNQLCRFSHTAEQQAITKQAQSRKRSAPVDGSANAAYHIKSSGI